MILSRHKELVMAVLLLVGTFMTFRPMLGHDFLTIDDHVYVTDNLYVQKGLSVESVIWAFTTLHAEFYHPVTWLSLMLDTQLFGVNPAGYLFSNLMLHILNTLLLFAVLVKLTRQPPASFFAAFLFAIHPLHVESVAWIAERKDVLSTFFWMLTIWCYVKYVQRPHIGRYCLVHMVYLMGLLAKPMLVTLPLVLLILDYWPLYRIRTEPAETEKPFRIILPLIKEKLLMILLAASAGILTIIAQYQGGGLDIMQEISFGQRVSNAFASVLVYIYRMIWPENLAVFYSLSNNINLFKLFGAASCILVITFLCIRFRHACPYLIAGWSWYLVTLLPVLGILKVGSFATADRYTYIPLIGLFIMLSWGLSELLDKLPRGKFLSAGLMGAIIMALIFKTTVQLQTWSDSKLLFSHAVEVTRNNDFAYHALGHLYAASGDFDKAAASFQQALKINPDRHVTKKDLARVWAHQARFEESEACLKQLLRERPDYGAAHYTLGLMLTAQRRYKEALAHISEGFRRHPRYRNNPDVEDGMSDRFGSLYEQGIRDIAGGHLTRARLSFERLLHLDPGYCPARIRLSDIRVSEKCYDCALKLFLDKLSDANIKQLLARGYDKWPVFSNAKGDPI